MASGSVKPIVPISGCAKTTVGMLLYSSLSDFSSGGPNSLFPSFLPAAMATVHGVKNFIEMKEKRRRRTYQG
jgi:hypothetical protein